MDRGADLQQLRELSKLYKQKAHDLQVLIKELDSKTSGSQSIWKGPKAERFRQDWQDVKPTFSKWVDTLNEASKSSNTSADNIERAT
ncbi:MULTISPECIES: WXG100 family type VII secretion target [Streptomyces]|uniref:WXG100 family type VII secretion target n=1 Tax=Streptomyces doudnae TaxID=3075536 RepID=A0ABD5EXA2_9ACTN|nr:MULTISPECIES: WXG100 family type VII secretion target [unclassified Streptomyces]MDT0439288.1 WXG100 family type VII secretion target [Streptomyces sp. DSM 41981]MYQ63459.1 WXG100 family type VII secretion target [Streptomyces sp. SID4950]SCD58595.1 WXG100 family type VII secretion target [Streptomyces sp. SolWspMP-5a-2]